MDIAVGQADDAETLIFINYRSNDSASAAAFLHAELSDRFGPESVFLDYESIPLGHDFVPILLARVRRCAVLVVVIGHGWLDGEMGQRPIDRPEDWVRREILAAFNNDIPVVPVLIGNASLGADRLPSELVTLANRQYFEVRDRRQRSDIHDLADHLTRQIPKLREHSESTPSTQPGSKSLHKGLEPFRTEDQKRFFLLATRGRLFLAATAFVLFAAIATLIIVVGTSKNGPSQSAAAVIVYPPDTEAVPKRIAAKGTVANLRTGYALFLVLDYDGCYFVHSVQVNDSEWSTEMDIGGDEVASGHEFTLSAVIADQDLTEAQRKQESGYFTSLDDLEEEYGVVVLTTNQIKRK